MVAVFQTLMAAYGPQGWWPGETPFEVMVGAVLTQSTSWANVERALAGLARRVPLEAHSILSLPPGELADCLRPVGYFNVKARRLRALCTACEAAGGVDGLACMPAEDLRIFLLGIHGVGPETADDMMLYAFGHPVFVVDAYTRRIFTRLGKLEGDEGYEIIRRRFEGALDPDPALLNEYHALIVKHGKDVCRTRPRCAECCLRGLCPYGAV